MKVNSDYAQVKRIMGENLIGVDEIKTIDLMKLSFPTFIPEIPFSIEELEQKKREYLLVLGISCFDDGTAVTIRNIQKLVGKNPDVAEPCFYNQDWYDKEKFIDVSLRNEWFLIRKNVYEDSRAVQPKDLMKKYSFPSAIKCTYTFFVAWFSRGMKLWYHDFVWCCDTDHNGDRIYVGKYHDIDGINKNGFNIHRHLALRPCYACID